MYNDGQWHTAVFSRNLREGSLEIDDGVESINMESSGNAGSVELTPPFYLGGLPTEVAAAAASNLDGVSTRFIGCLRYLKQNAEEVDAPSDEIGTEPCDAESEPGTFFYTDGGHLVLAESYSVPLDLEINIEIRPRTLSGVILSVFSHGSGPPGGDYLVLQLVNGEVVFSMDNGQGEVMAVYNPSAKNELCDGEWHRIKAVKAKNIVTLEVDGIITSPGLGQEGISHTNTADELYIGGVPEFHRGIKTRDQYVGCMRNLRLGADSPDTARLADARAVGNVKLTACPTN
jgi:laminin alpha 3/5